jgi:hypothetical protein
MERQIGDKFLTPEGVELEVVETTDCDECYYLKRNLFCDTTMCTAVLWLEGKDVIFKQTK